MIIYIPDKTTKKIKSSPADVQNKVVRSLIEISAVDDIRSTQFNQKIHTLNTGSLSYRISDSIRLIVRIFKDNENLIFSVEDLIRYDENPSHVVKTDQEKVKRWITSLPRATSSYVALSIIEKLEIESPDFSDQHPNIQILLRRMDRDLAAKDYSGVLHSSASIFETLAKETVKLPTIQNQTLAAFFDRFKKDVNLPDEIADYILKVYKKRNTEPLAGHGSLDSSTVDKKDAIAIAELTKAIIRIQKIFISSGPD